MKQKIITLTISLLAAPLLFTLPRKLPGLFEPWYPAFSRFVSCALSVLTGFAPFSFCELALYLGAVGMVVYFVMSVVKRRGRLALMRVVTIIAASLDLFFLFWGINYALPSVIEREGVIVPVEITIQRLNAAAEYFRGLANASHTPERPSDKQLRAAVRDAYRAIDYDFIIPWAAKTKRLTFWFVQSYTDISGVYLPWTGEGNYNPDTPYPNIAVTMAHESAHRQGAAFEDDANLLALLVCLGASDGALNYAGAFEGFIYLSNAVTDYDTSKRLWEGLSPEVLSDLRSVTDHYAKYRQSAVGKVTTEAGEAVNDAYLKTMNQPEGVKTYGRVTDLLISYLVNKGIIA